MPSELIRQLIDNEARLTAAWGDALPQFTPDVLANAERAAAAGGKASENGPGWMTGLNPQTLGDLAAAFRQTRDARYAAVVHSYIGHWVDKELDARGKWAKPAYYDALMIPHRLGDTECIGWFGALPHVLDSGLFDEVFLGRLIDSARQQLEYLAATVFEGRNIRMTQGDALFTAGERLNWLPEAPRWRELGLEILNDAFNRQIGPDGTGEASGWYHYIEANMALRYWRAGRAWPNVVIQLAAETVGQMFDYLAGAVEPCGLLNRIGDCTAGMPPDSRLASVLARHRDICRELGRSPAPATHQFFAHAQQAFWRSDWGDQADYVTFDATRRYGYHWHPSLNAIQLHIRGRRVLADPGRMGYDATPQRRYACATRGHCTMNLNGLNQAWVRPTVRCRQLDGYDLIDSFYQGGYWDDSQSAGIFGEHHRAALWIRGRMLVVFDHMLHHQGAGRKPVVECNWQFAPGKVTLDAAPGRRVFSEHGPAKMMMLRPVEPAGGELGIHEGLLGGELCAGWVADQADQPAPAPLLRCAWPQFDLWNFDLATVLLPYEGKPPQVAVENVQAPETGGGTGRFALRWADGWRDEFWWKRRLEYALETCAGFTTDAALVHLRIDPAGRMTQALVFDGSFLKPFTKSVRPGPETFVCRP